MGTLGDSTSKRLAAVVRGINGAGAASALAPKGSAAYYGGWAGPAGTWSKSPRFNGREDARSSSQPRPLQTHEANTSGRRDKIRPNSEGERALWDTLPAKELPNAPAKGGRPVSPHRQRPKSASTARERPKCAPVPTVCCLHSSSLAGTCALEAFKRLTMPDEAHSCACRTAVQPVEYAMSGLGLTAASPTKSSRRPCTARTPTNGSDATFIDPYSPRRPGKPAQRDATSIMSALVSGMTTGAHEGDHPSSAIHGKHAADPSTHAHHGHYSQENVAGPLEGDVEAVEAVPQARVAALETALQTALRRRRSVYEGERALLEKALRQVDGGGGGESVSAADLVKVRLVLCSGCGVGKTGRARAHQAASSVCFLGTLLSDFSKVVSFSRSSVASMCVHRCSRYSASPLLSLKCSRSSAATAAPAP